MYLKYVHCDRSACMLQGAQAKAPKMKAKAGKAPKVKAKGKVKAAASKSKAKANAGKDGKSSSSLPVLKKPAANDVSEAKGWFHNIVCVT